MPTQKRYSPEFRERTIRLFEEHRSEYPSTWAAVKSISAKAGMNPETLRSWVLQAERDAGQRPGLTTDDSFDANSNRCSTATTCDRWCRRRLLAR